MQNTTAENTPSNSQEHVTQMRARRPQKAPSLGKKTTFFVINALYILRGHTQKRKNKRSQMTSYDFKNESPEYRKR